MSAYGYMNKQSVSSYNTLREDSRPVIKPFVPFVPSAGGNSYGYAAKKTIVPVTSGPYDDDDDYNKKHSYQHPSESYPVRSGDDEWRRQRSPVRGSPRKVDEFIAKVHNDANRPPRFGPVAAAPTDWRQSPHQPTYGGGGGDYGSNHKEGRKPVGGPYDGHNGYGDYGNYGAGNKEGHKPIGGYDRHNGPGGAYGNYGDKEGYKPIGTTVRSDCYNSPNGYGDYNNNPILNDKYDGANNGYGNHNNKEGYSPIRSPIRNDKYDGYDGGYCNHNNKEGYSPIRSPVRNDEYDGYDGGYGNPNNKEGHNYNGCNGGNNGYCDYGGGCNNKTSIIPGGGGGFNKPKISTAWTAQPRKGTQLSEPTNDINKAMELLKVAAKVTSNGKGGNNKHETPSSNNNRASSLVNGSPIGEARGKIDKGMELVKEAERLKSIVTGPQKPAAAMPTASRYGNFNFASRPHTPSPTKHVSFADDADDYRNDVRSYGNTSVIDSRFAEKKYGGTRV